MINAGGVSFLKLLTMAEYLLFNKPYRRPRLPEDSELNKYKGKVLEALRGHPKIS